MARALPRIETPRTIVLLPDRGFAGRMIDYYRRNQEHLAPWEPQRGGEFWTLEWWENQLDLNVREFHDDHGARMVILGRDDPEQRVIGVVNLSNLVRGSFQAGTLGYSIDREVEGRGVMFEALEAVVHYAFSTLGLHRVMANYQPCNVRSGRLLERLGFVREGYARAYLHIDGAWRDHVLTARTAPEGSGNARPERGRGGPEKEQGPAGGPAGPLDS